MSCNLLINSNLYLLNNLIDVICPFCHYLDKESDSLQYDDYVDVPMIWCSGCGCRSFLDLSIQDLNNIYTDIEEDKLQKELLQI